MKKSRYEKFEEMLNEIMQEHNLDAKIREMEEQIHSIQIMTSDEIDYTDDTIEDYQKNRTLIKDLEERIKFYKIFRDNRKQILNIRQYQRINQEESESLKSELDSLSEKRERIRKLINNEKRSIADQSKRNIKKQELLEKQLARKDLSQDERQKLRKEMETLSDKMDENYKRFVAFMEGDEFKEKKAEYEEANKRASEIKRKITKIEITLSECNAMWSSLLKGRNWDEIKTILEKGDFKAPKGTEYKIYKISQLKGEVDYLNEKETPNNETQIDENKIENEIQKSIATDETQAKVSSFMSKFIKEENKTEINEDKAEALYKKIREQRIEMVKERRKHNVFYRMIPLVKKIIDKKDAKRIESELIPIKKDLVSLNTGELNTISAKDLKDAWTRILDKRDAQNGNVVEAKKVEQIEQKGQEKDLRTTEKRYDSEIDYIEGQKKGKNGEKAKIYAQIAEEGFIKTVTNLQQEEQIKKEKKIKEQEERAAKRAKIEAEKAAKKLSVEKRKETIEEKKKRQEEEKAAKARHAAFVKQYKLNKEKAAKELAKKYGGRYNEQDGAEKKGKQKTPQAVR